MSKKNLIIIAVSLILILGVGGYLLFKQSKNSTTPPGSISTNPFGNTSPNNGNQVTTSLTDTTSQSSTGFGSKAFDAPTLVQLNKNPGASGIIYQNKTPIARYIDRATGNVFDYSLASSTVQRVSNTTIPHLSLSLWSSNAKNVLLQYINDNNVVETYAGAIVSLKNSTTTEQLPTALQGRILSQNILGLAISPSGTRMFYLLPTSAGADGYIANVDGTHSVKVFSSPLSEFQVFWPQEGSILLATKPAAGVLGYVYSLNTSSHAISQILGGIAGLTIKPDGSGTYIAYADDTNTLRVFSLKTNTAVDTGVNTLAEKCVWSTKQKGTLYCAVPNTLPDGKYPDSWYQGAVSFTDSIVSITASTITAKAGVLVRPFEEYQQSLDATDLSLSPNEDYLMFTNKKDYTLWALNLNTL